jgi:alkylation response protein AidB-like acyl-CoA dehydrogenase
MIADALLHVTAARMVQRTVRGRTRRVMTTVARMPIAITEAHRELEEVARAFLERAGARDAARDLLDAPEESLPRFWDDLVALGWLGLHLPEKYGGSGYGLPELVVVLQELGRALAPGPFLPAVLASSVLAAAGDDAQQAVLLPELADGARIGALGVAGSVAYGGSVANGSCVVLGPALADRFLLVAGEDVLVVERDTPGCTVQLGGDLDPTRRSGRVHLDGVEVPPELMLRGAAGVARDLARLLLGAEAAGGAQECVDRATEYAKVRQQFGRPIAMFQAVKHHCANMLVASEMATAAVWDAARAFAAGGDQFSVAAAVAAVEAMPAFLRNAQLNIQVHGGVGFTWEHDGHMLLRRAAALAAFSDHEAAARTVVDSGLAGVQREFGIDLPPEAEPIRSTTRAIAEELATLDEREQRARLIDSGYVQPHWPKPWGREASALEQLVIDEEFARAGVQRPQFGITAWVILTIIAHATPDQIARWVRPTLAGDLVWCQLFSEPEAGSDAAGVRTRATRVDGGFLVNGQKVWTSGAQYCHRGLATVRTNPDVAKHDGITTVVIDMHADGVEVRPLREASGASMFNEVFFTDVFVPDDDVVGPVDGGWTVARATLGNERVSIGSGVGVGFSIDMLRLFREHGTGKDGISTAVGEHLAEAHVLRLLNLRSAERAVAGGEPGPEGNVTKLISAEHMQRSADLALRMIGPDVALLEGDGGMVAMVLIFSRAMTIAGGTSEITRNQIGERILGLPRDPLIK